MSADLVLAGLAESTRTKYVLCAAQFVKFFMLPPTELGEPHVRRFLLFLVHERKLAVGTYLPYLGALKFLFRVTLGRPEAVAGIPWPRTPKRLPTALTRAEVLVVFAAAPSPYWRMFFTVAYAAGLRRMEVAALRAENIDSTSMLLRVEAGKGGKSRVVMLDPDLLVMLRKHWKDQGLARPWLFPEPSPAGGWLGRPVELRDASNAFRQARITAKLSRPATLHWLRHSFATHLLEEGVNINVLQLLLGHERLETTAGYTLVRTDLIRATPSPLKKTLGH